MKTLIRKIFKRKLKGVSIALCIVLGCFSCQKDNLLINISGEPDKVIESTFGTLYYHKKLKMWCVNHYVPGTIDANDRYLIVGISEKNIFKEGKQVLVSGLCYFIPPQVCRHLYYDHLAGVAFYYIKVTNITNL